VNKESYSRDKNGGIDRNQERIDKESLQIGSEIVPEFTDFS